MNGEVDANVSESLKTEIEEIALKSGIDLRDYAAQIENELMKIESSLISTYIKVSPEVASMHKQITICDAILERMENILTNFHEDLGTISAEIQDLQGRSMIMNTRLQNRQSVRGELSQFLSDMAIPEDLIRHILLTPVTEQDFLENLHELNHKINFAMEKSMVDYKSFNDVSVLLKKLKIKAVTKIREFLLQKIYSLRKPLTNYQISQNQMLKFRFYNSFLIVHDREIAKEIKIEYINTMNKVYYSYFKAYAGKLAKLLLDTTNEKDDLLGKNPDKTGSTTSTTNLMMNSIAHVGSSSTGSIATSSSSRLGLFGLGERAYRVLSETNLESPIILPHVANTAEVKYPVEVLFRSIHYALLDTTCREYYFLSDFFMINPDLIIDSHTQSNDLSTNTNGSIALNNLFEQVMGRSLNWLQKFTENSIISSNSHDALGLLICLQLSHAMLRLAKERCVPVLDKFWNKLTETLWVRVTDRLDIHISSISHNHHHNLDVNNFNHGARDIIQTSTSTNLHPKIYTLIRPHWITRRYAELAASLHLIGHEFPGTPLFADNITKSKSNEYMNDVQRKLSDSNRLISNQSMDHSQHQPNFSSINPLKQIDNNNSVTNPIQTSLFSSTISNSTTATMTTNTTAHTNNTITATTTTATTITTTTNNSNTTSNRPNLDPRILSRLAQLQTQFEHVLNLLAKTFTKPRLAYIFLINNYDLVISVLSEHGANDSAEVNRCRDAVSKHMTMFIDEALNPYFGSLISFVRDAEIKLSNTQQNRTNQEQTDSSSHNEEARVTRIVKGFNIDWKNSIEKIHDEIMIEFTNFTLGIQIFQALLAQLVQHYHRFQKVMTQTPYKNMPIRNQLVNIHHIMNEIKKCKTNF